jgi:transcriptional regulator with XRE-family HTH domain
LREQAGLSQKDLAKMLKTSQQQISRLESPGYEGHSLSMLRRVAEVLNARVRVVLEPKKSAARAQVAERAAAYRNHRNAPHRKAERNYGCRESRSSALQKAGEKNQTGVNMTAAKIDRRFLQTIV